ncbi:hypothetical protein M2347_004186 [Chryseobacterium sp. H1D6B]|uniref:hypothetical protein n=1 Tax=Chryseobacterium sp. H1D6B TaxID=2940588 RepID=UPI0015CA932A|nr:hypothetical protein [Chryseobacterium sp. H1D6B]MDH6254459.1 hypothetical protein [Chryseobacterium sp. H1D6B]
MMTKILMQNMFYNHGSEYYLITCNVQGEINMGDYIVINPDIKIKIEKIENGLFETLVLSVSRDFFERANDNLYNKEFFIEKLVSTLPKISNILNYNNKPHRN